MLKIGDTAPDFELKDQSGTSITLDQLVADGDLILYFYPADYSPVCTAEACAFRDHFEDVADIGSTIVGINSQSVQSHQRFAKSFKLPFPILSDSKGKVIRAYGVQGPLGIGVRRVTFLIDRDKIIRNRVASELFVGSHTDLLKATVRANKVA